MGSAIIVAPGRLEPSCTSATSITLRAGDDHARFTHRITEILDRPDGRYVRTKGDANERPDPTPVHAVGDRGPRPGLDPDGRLPHRPPVDPDRRPVRDRRRRDAARRGLAARVARARPGRPEPRRHRHGRPAAATPASRCRPPTGGDAIASPPDAGFGAMRLSVADQIALSRSTRARRDRWQADHAARPAAATTAARSEAVPRVHRRFAALGLSLALIAVAAVAAPATLARLTDQDTVDALALDRHARPADRPRCDRTGDGVAHLDRQHRRLRRRLPGLPEHDERQRLRARRAASRRAPRPRPRTRPAPGRTTTSCARTSRTGSASPATRRR